MHFQLVAARLHVYGVWKSILFLGLINLNSKIELHHINHALLIADHTSMDSAHACMRTHPKAHFNRSCIVCVYQNGNVWIQKHICTHVQSWSHITHEATQKKPYTRVQNSQKQIPWEKDYTVGTLLLNINILTPPTKVDQYNMYIAEICSAI